MRITSIESRVIGYDVAEAWGAVLPEGITTTWYEYSFDTFHTDDGLVGYTNQNANLRDGGAMIHVLHDLYAPQLIGQDPMQRRGDLAAAAPAEPPRLQPVRFDGRRHRRRALGHARQGGGPADRDDARAGPRCGSRRTRRPATSTRRPRTCSRRPTTRKAQGYHGFKIQFWDGLDRDIPRFRAAREAVGPDFPLMQDAAGMYSYAEALAAGQVLGELDYAWFEEPIPDRNLFQLQRLTDQLDVPILAGETSRVHELAEAMRMGAFDIARGDVLMKEGITGLRKAAGMADLLGFDLEVHGINQPLLDVANLHVALSITNCRWSETFHPIYYRGLTGEPLEIDADGYKHLPAGPGLGRRDRLGLDRPTTRRPPGAPRPRRGRGLRSVSAGNRTTMSSRHDRRAPVAIATAARPSAPPMAGGRSSRIASTRSASWAAKARRK